MSILVEIYTLGTGNAAEILQVKKLKIKNLLFPVLSLAVYLWLPSAALGVVCVVGYWRLRVNI